MLVGWAGWVGVWRIVYVMTRGVLSLLVCAGWLGADVARYVCGGMRDARSRTSRRVRIGSRTDSRGPWIR